MTKKVWFKNNKGQKLAGILHIPKKFPGQKPAGVVLCHGHHDTKDRNHLKEIASGLTKAGMMSLRFDLSGNGESQGQFKKETYTQYIKDYKSAVDFIARQGIKRIGVVGHSMAGTIILEERIYDHRIHCIGLYNPVTYLKEVHGKSLKAKDYRKLKEKGYYSFVSVHDGIEYYTYKPFFDDLKNHDPLQAAKAVTCPVIIYQSTKDSNMPVSHSRDLYKALLTEVKFLKIMKADHNFRQKKVRQELVKDIVYWFSKYLHYRSPVINAFVQHQGKLLMLKRSDRVGTHQGMWDCVGGYLMSDLARDGELKIKEDPKTRAIYEIGEELGIARKDLKLIKEVKPVEWYDQPEDKTWYIYPFLFESKTEQIKLDWEHTNYKWITLQQLKKFRHIKGLDINLKKLIKK
ncbi:MAG: alpha/beta hydrolase [Patescibacteria group bacterium]